MTKIQISFVPFNDGDWEFIIRNEDDGYEVVLSKGMELTKEDKKKLHDIAPACVWTEYEGKV